MIFAIQNYVLDQKSHNYSLILFGPNALGPNNINVFVTSSLFGPIAFGPIRSYENIIGPIVIGPINLIISIGCKHPSGYSKVTIITSY